MLFVPDIAIGEVNWLGGNIQVGREQSLPYLHWRQNVGVDMASLGGPTD